MTLDDLISPTYRQEQVWLHAQPRGYGGKGKKWATAVQALVWTYNCQSVLDYGCGEGSLVNFLMAVNRTDQFACKDFPPRCTDFREYDPAIDGKTDLPEPADLVVCTEVLEHIEPDKLEAVITHLRSLTRKVLYVAIGTQESNKTLPDGRNAHLIIESPAWWRAQFDDWRIISGIERSCKEWLMVLMP
jgi:hypothetical protein